MKIKPLLRAYGGSFSDHAQVVEETTYLILQLETVIVLLWHRKFSLVWTPALCDEKPNLTEVYITKR